jgi:hypothetical protein
VAEMYSREIDLSEDERTSLERMVHNYKNAESEERKRN